MIYEDAVSRLKERFGPEAIKTTEFRDNRRVHVETSIVYAVLEYLKRDCGFGMLAELSAADYLHYPNATDRYGIWYVLVNVDDGTRIVVKTFANDPDPTVPSVYSLWRGADWMEREVYDMYGVVFEGHPDLRRILMPDEFTAYPMRKDYPMRGRGERHNFPIITRAES